MWRYVVDIQHVVGKLGAVVVVDPRSLNLPQHKSQHPECVHYEYWIGVEEGWEGMVCGDGEHRRLAVHPPLHQLHIASSHDWRVRVNNELLLSAQCHIRQHQQWFCAPCLFATCLCLDGCNVTVEHRQLARHNALGWRPPQQHSVYCSNVDSVGPSSLSSHRLMHLRGKGGKHNDYKASHLTSLPSPTCSS
ncbi:unnamed protein product [Hydatigera taeniaeformis]|uniref:Uncharacterized protein n=1 Tax=Hydatigena taeniaeformis TaxID=6205 RepID=A0A0R3WLM3_HYDTA|nr:unnamed protein product [Hydatigera taeniaeformis]